MKKQTIVLMVALLVLVNIGLFITIYNLINPENKLLIDEIRAYNPKEQFEQKLGVQKEELEEEIIAEPKQTKAANKVPEVSAEELTEKELNELENVYTVKEWNLSFQLPDDPSQYTITVNSDLVTIEKHLQVYAYILRYAEGVKPSIEGQWDALGIYEGKSYYLRHGTSIVPNADEQNIDEARQAVYDSILNTYFFQAVN